MTAPNSCDQHHTSYITLEEAGLSKTIKSIGFGNFILDINVVDEFYTCCASREPFYFNLFKKDIRQDSGCIYLLQIGIKSIDEIVEHINKSEITEEAKESIISELKELEIDLSDPKIHLEAPQGFRLKKIINMPGQPVSHVEVYTVENILTK